MGWWSVLHVGIGTGVPASEVADHGCAPTIVAQQVRGP